MVASPCLGNNVFIDHDTTDVVASKLQSNLACLQALGNPGRLYVEKIVKVKTGDCQRLQVFDAGGFFLDESAERCVFALERPGDEGREPAGLVLKIPNQIEVVHPLLDRLAAAKHHGCSGAHPQLMRGAMY